jgi:hypothetical protein
LQGFPTPRLTKLFSPNHLCWGSGRCRPYVLLMRQLPGSAASSCDMPAINDAWGLDPQQILTLSTCFSFREDLVFISPCHVVPKRATYYIRGFLRLFKIQSAVGCNAATTGSIQLGRLPGYTGCEVCHLSLSIAVTSAQD